jgi:hypothetical protein
VTFTGARTGAVAFTGAGAVALTAKTGGKAGATSGAGDGAVRLCAAGAVAFAGAAVRFAAGGSSVRFPTGAGAGAGGNIGACTMQKKSLIIEYIPFEGKYNNFSRQSLCFQQSI